MFLLYFVAILFQNKVGHNSKMELLITHVYIDIIPKVVPYI